MTPGMGAAQGSFQRHVCHHSGPCCLWGSNSRLDGGSGAGLQAELWSLQPPDPAGLSLRLLPALPQAVRSPWLERAGLHCYVLRPSTASGSFCLVDACLWTWGWSRLLIHASGALPPVRVPVLFLELACSFPGLTCCSSVQSRHSWMRP